jgi:hypothetical protein
MADEQSIKDAILQHVGLYRLTIDAVVRHLFFNDVPKTKTKDPVQSALDELVGEKLLRKQELPHKVDCWTLTVLGTKKAGVPRARGLPTGPQATPTHLPVLWFCCMAEQRRYRLEPKEDLAPLLGDWKPHNNIPHCICQDDDGPRIYRLFTPSTEPIEAVQSAIATLDEIFITNRELYEWIEARDYGFALLGATSSKCADFNRLIEKAPEGILPLSQRCQCIARLGPSPDTIRMALDKHFSQ